MVFWWMVAAMVSGGALAAESGELTPRFGPRTVKIDLFGFAPGKPRWGSDWKISTLEQWSAVLACTPDGARRERCRFVDGVWWGVVVADETQQTLVKLPAPGELVFAWTARGRLASWTVAGDRSAFWTEASNAVLQHTFHRQDMVFKPNGQREVGERLEELLARWLAASLEWELPKDGDPSKSWKVTQAPINGRRWTQSIASAEVELAVTDSDAQQTTFSMAGTVSERVTSSLVTDLNIQTALAGSASFDKESGTITRAKLETVVRSATGPLEGHTRSISVVIPWAEGQSTEPADMPEPVL